MSYYKLHQFVQGCCNLDLYEFSFFIYYPGNKPMDPVAETRLHVVNLNGEIFTKLLPLKDF